MWWYGLTYLGDAQLQTWNWYELMVVSFFQGMEVGKIGMDMTWQQVYVFTGVLHPFLSILIVVIRTNENSVSLLLGFYNFTPEVCWFVYDFMFVFNDILYLYVKH